MTASDSSDAIGRTGVAAVLPPQGVLGPRHRAPVVPGELRIATPEDLLRTGRHAEPAWTRDLPVFDTLRDEMAAVDWFSLPTGRA